MNEVAEEHYAKRNKVTRSILMQAVNEECQVITTFGTRTGMHFLDCDTTHAMFKGHGNVVIINLEEIQSLEFKHEEDTDGEYIQDKNPEAGH